ncbi:uncharacterized protein LOC105686140 [Athalia rosae]|uniref:uncharacterized protein LOC105686140 n=1 Tax=Athalia rosae TaxID=37344 RepID=UPI0020335C6B|nr:uncharacterized protein LOC105686140 [Athalia rosae]
MRIRRPRGLSNSQIIFASILGTFGGFYIWKPEFDRLRAREEKALETTTQSSTTTYLFIIQERRPKMIGVSRLWQSYVKQANSSSGLMIAIGILSISCIYGWKKGVQPVLRQRKREEAEEFADFLFEEHKKKLGKNMP